jgi:uncharacterized protein YndB with AHSA1/START domain
VSKPAVTKHLKVLEEAGVVARTVAGRTHVLRLRPRALRDATRWLEMHRALWESKFDVIEEHLSEGGDRMAGIGTETTALELTHRFAAPRDEVFDAWTNPDVLRKWWSAADTWSTPLAEVDARPGGRYRLSMKTDEGEIHTVAGEYHEVDRPERLVYTWQWEEGPEPVQGGNDTLVTVEFVEDGDGTVVKLTHTGFPSQEIMGMHEHGWKAVLAKLERVLS